MELIYGGRKVKVTYEIGVFKDEKPIFLLISSRAKRSDFLSAFCEYLSNIIENTIDFPMPDGCYIAWDIMERRQSDKFKW